MKRGTLGKIITVLALLLILVFFTVKLKEPIDLHVLPISGQIASPSIFTEDGTTVGRKITDDSSYETRFTVTEIRGNNLVLEFSHNASNHLPVWIEGEVVT